MSRMDASQRQPVTDITRTISRGTTSATTRAITRATVFDIPLLIDLIARHLTSRDIYKCTLVSHQFYDAFQHSLYTCISIQREANLKMFLCKDARAAFARHHVHIQEVSTALGECLVFLADSIDPSWTPSQSLDSVPLLRSLTTLRYVFNPTERYRENDVQLISTSLLSLVEASPALQILHISDFNYSYPLIQRLAKAIREKGRRLKEFRAYQADLLCAKHLRILLWSCAAVEVLQIGCGTHGRGPERPFEETLPELRTLAREALCSNGLGFHTAQTRALDTTELLQDAERIEFAWKEIGRGLWLADLELEDIVELLQSCPNLERMAVPRLSEDDIFTHLAPIVSNTMPRLYHLDLIFIKNRSLGISHLLQSCKDLTSLQFGNPILHSPQLVDALVSGHGHSLQALDIRIFDKLSSPELNLILSRCRGLKELLASMEAYPLERSWVKGTPILSTKDMAMVPEEPGWGCKNLETLELCYNGMDTIFGIPKVLWRQIGQLRKLKNLCLQRSGACEGPAVKEKESVRQAVFSWMALPDLRRLELRGVNAFMDKTLVCDVQKQWPQLEWVRYSYD
ncbi:hypothetical protein BGZ70_001343 [Mortierella alpina]|uniref:F-box domain-containing protein n=1 Tax=Mortierella alpina TaxID=64518 RepID=A0A9P6IXW2_MORAP|nr:hypothetical protein BGZ70_001343 [Mortierella alpina]